MKYHRSQPTQSAIAAEVSNSPITPPHTKTYIQKLFPSSDQSPPLFPQQNNRVYFRILNTSENAPPHQPPKQQAQPPSRLPPLYPPTSLPHYIQDLGWVEWLQSTRLSPTFLKQLVAPPTQNSINIGCSTLSKVENGLLKTSGLLKEYLHAADQQLSLLTSGIRDAIRGE